MTARPILSVLDVYSQAYGKERGSDSPISLEDMYEEAEDVIREMKANPFKPGAVEYDPGFVSSFIVYPMSQALSYAKSPCRCFGRYSHVFEKKQDERLLPPRNGGP